MKRFKAIGGTLLACALLAVCGGTSLVSASDGNVKESTTARLSYFIKQNHPNPFTEINEEEFDSRIQTLETDWEKLSQEADGGYYAVRELVAALGDEHTTLSPAPEMSQSQLPFFVMPFDGRLLIVQAQNSFPQLPGKELLAVNDVEVPQICEKLLPILSYDSKEWAEVMSAQELCSLQSLSYVGVIDDLEKVKVTVKDLESGGTESMEVTPVTDGYPYETSTVVSFIPQTIAQSGYYYGTLLEDGTLFIQYNMCADNPEMPMSEFADQIWAQMKEQVPEKMIVDLRHNSGGNSEIIKPLLSVLEDLQEEGSTLYCLIGSETFSSGLMAAADLEDAGAVLVGTPTGGIFGFGEVRQFQLPDGFTLNCSTKDFSGYGGQEGQISPEIEVKQTIEDLLDGKDSAVEYIKTLGGNEK